MEFGWRFVNEILQLLKPEPATDRELEAAAGVSDVDYAIYSERLQIICDEAKEIFVRCGRSNFLLAGDLVVGLYTAQGDLVCAMAGAYIHFVTGTPPIKYIMRRWKDDPTVGLNEGDLFFNNDPLFGSLHTVDQAVLMPIFSNGELIAWAGAAVHEGDIGCGPGPGQPAACRSRFDEGLKVAPLKIGENYQLREDIVHMLGNMTRSPELHETDLRARAAACDRVRIRIQQLAKEKGNNFILPLMRRMLIETERGAKEMIKRWNDGKYRSVSFPDTLGYKQALVKWTLTVIKEDDRCTLDFSECSPENDGSYNNFAHQIVAHFIHTLYLGIWSTLPLSAGVFVPLDFIFKPGSILHASPWASTVNSPPAASRVIQLTLNCYSKMIFASEEDRPMLMAGYGAGIAIIFAGMNQWNMMVADIDTITMNEGGGGARYNRDGVNTFIFGHCPWGKAPDIEEVEAERPWLVLYCSHLKDGGGFGKYRGGCGMSLAMLQHHTPWLGVGSVSAGRRPMAQAATNLFGGYPASTNELIRVRHTDVFERMSKGDIVTPRSPQELIKEKTIRGEYEVIGPEGAAVTPLMRGDVYAGTQIGGGGYGDVLEREPERVMKDIREEIISHWTAKNVYKVAYDPDTLEVHYKKTEELRQLEREDRKKRGKKYEEFEKEWLTKRPPEKALEWYGSWPDANPTRTVIRI
jgi:N-methylhydantoinase B/oxoprolinase/acetone carboxylase alpha subunit